MPKKKDKRATGVEKVARALAKEEEKARWAPYLKLIGLNQDSADRLTRLLVLHLMLDRGLTGLITFKLFDGSVSFLDIERTVARLPISRRIELAKVAKLITTPCSEDIQDINKLRNKFAHYNPVGGWDLGKLKELASEEEFYKCTEKGLEAMYQISRFLGNKLGGVGRSRPVPSHDPNQPDMYKGAPTEGEASSSCE